MLHSIQLHDLKGFGPNLRQVTSDAARTHIESGASPHGDTGRGPVAPWLRLSLAVIAEILNSFTIPNIVSYAIYLIAVIQTGNCYCLLRTAVVNASIDSSEDPRIVQHSSDGGS